MEVAAVALACGDLLRAAEAALRRAGVPTPRLDAEVLLGRAMDADRTLLFSRLGDEVPASIATRFASFVARRCRREPVAYITGAQEFWSLSFAVTPAVLIPRPETELVVEAVRALVAEEPSAPAVCDVGTGSGCVAVALARELPGARLWATDISPAALAVAQRNAAAHGVGEHIAFACGDLFADIDPAVRFDVVASNPPYVADGAVLPAEVACEPAIALRAGHDGLDVIRRLLRTAPSRLRRGGWLVMEFGFGQAKAVRDLAAAAGFDRVCTETDLAGIPRVLIARMACGPMKKTPLMVRQAQRERDATRGTQRFAYPQVVEGPAKRVFQRAAGGDGPGPGTRQPTPYG